MPKTFIKNLLMRVLRIETAIDREQSRRAPDSLRLLHLKKLRLALKDRINNLTPRRSSQNRSFTA